MNIQSNTLCSTWNLVSHCHIKWLSKFPQVRASAPFCVSVCVSAFLYNRAGVKSLCVAFLNHEKIKIYSTPFEQQALEVLVQVPGHITVKLCRTNICALIAYIMQSCCLICGATLSQKKIVKSINVFMCPSWMLRSTSGFPMVQEQWTMGKTPVLNSHREITLIDV